MRIHSVTISDDVYTRTSDIDIVIHLKFLFGSDGFEVAYNYGAWSTTFTRAKPNEQKRNNEPAQDATK